MNVCGFFFLKPYTFFQISQYTLVLRMWFELLSKFTRNWADPLICWAVLSWMVLKLMGSGSSRCIISSAWYTGTWKERISATQLVWRTKLKWSTQPHLTASTWVTWIIIIFLLPALKLSLHIFFFNFKVVNWIVIRFLQDTSIYWFEANTCKIN